MPSKAPFLQLSQNRRYLTTENGKPFFWLADTWWYGLTDRTAWPEPFQKLVRRRVDQGFTVVMMVVGVPPEISLDSSQANSDGHHPYLADFAPNPAYFDAIDKKIAYVVDQGLVPCLVGGWGPQMQALGQQRFSEFWSEIIRRFAKYPVVWCLTGEVDLTTLTPAKKTFPKQVLQSLPDPLKNALRSLKHALIPARVNPAAVTPQLTDWLAVADHIRTLDSSHLLLVHPHTQQLSSEILHQPAWLEVDSIQSGHSEDSRLFLTEQAVKASQHRVFINLEPLYEGILGHDSPTFQRFAFWMSVLAGAKGHTYGADGLWNMRTADHFLGHWGNTAWTEALQRAGGEQLGIAKKWLDTHLSWWTLTPSLAAIAPHWQADTACEQLPLCSTTDDHHYLCYFPAGRPQHNYLWQVSGSWECAWLDPQTLTSIHHCRIDHSSTEPTTLQLPQSDGDLLLLVRPQQKQKK